MLEEHWILEQPELSHLQTLQTGKLLQDTFLVLLHCQEIQE